MLKYTKISTIKMVRGQESKLGFTFKLLVFATLLISTMTMAKNIRSMTLVDAITAVCDQSDISVESVRDSLGIQLELKESLDPLGLGNTGYHGWEASKSSDIVRSVALYDESLSLVINNDIDVDPGIVSLFHERDIIEVGMLAHGKMVFRKVHYRKYEITFIYRRVKGDNDLIKVVIGRVRAH